MARLYRDAFGVPHLRAGSLLDLARAQGRVTVADRAWQLEWLRRRATGTTAAAVGDAGFTWDRFSRRMRTVETAQRAYAGCGEETRRYVAAYVDGVNQGWAELDPAAVPEFVELDLTPQPWEPWTPLATFLAQHLLFGSIGGQLWQRLSTAVLGEAAGMLAREDPTAAGSNVWAVGGKRTAGGVPLIGGDPHRNIEQPGVYQQVRLACEEPSDPFDVVGFTFVGVPGVQHFAHAGKVAWAITNACADYQDVSELTSATRQLDHRVERIEIREGEPVDIDVVLTEQGLVFADGLAARTSSWELGDLGFDALLPLLRARTVDDVDRALDSWVEPVNNAVIADDAGAVRYRIAGRVPVRADGAWAGWLGEPNRRDIPADGQVVSANERRGPESDAIGSDFAPPYRARRLHALLDGRSGLTTADYVAFHNDALLLTVPIVTALVPGGFDDFDGVMAAESSQAARYAAFRSALVRRIAAEPVFDPLREPPAGHRHDDVFAPWLGAAYRIGLSLPRLANEALAGHRPFGIDVVAHARDALAEVDAHPVSASWGDTHVVVPEHALDGVVDSAVDLPALSVSGDTDCVRACVSYAALSDECSRGPVARYVWDLADRTAGGWVVPTGAHGTPGDPHHHDQLPLWAAGELAPIVTDWTALQLQSDFSST